MAISERFLEAAEAGRNVPATLRALRRHHGVSAQKIADWMGVKRQSIDQRLKGKTTISPEELRGFAVFFGVPLDVLYLPVNEALRWVIDHPEIVDESAAAEQGTSRSRCRALIAA